MKALRNGRHTQSWWLAAIFGGFVLVLVLLGFVLHRQSRSAADASAQEALSTTARLSAHGVNQWMAERHANADVLAEVPFLQEGLAFWPDSGPERVAQAQAVRAYIERFRQRYDYQAVALIDTAAQQVLASSGRALSDMEVRHLVQAGTGTGTQSTWLELPANEGPGLRAGIWRSVASGTRHAIYLEINPDKLVATLQQAQPRNWPGETLLLRRAGAEVGYLSSEGQSVLKRLEQVPAAASAELALLGGPSKDLRAANRRGEPVLATREPLSMPSWHLVSMLSEASVYAPLARQTRLTLATLAILLLLGGVALMAWLRNEKYRQLLRESGVRRYYEEVLRHAAEIFILTNAQGQIVQASESALKAYGYTREQMLRLTVAQLNLSGQAEGAAQIARGMQAGETRSFQLARRRADGSTFLFEGSLGMIEVEGQRFYHTIGRDVTQRQSEELQRRIAAGVFERSSAGIAISDLQRRCVMVNPAFTRITGYEASEIVGQDTDMLYVDFGAESVRQMLKAVAMDGHWEGEQWGRRKNGEVYSSWLFISAHRDDSGQFEQFVSIFSDQTRLKQAEKQAEYLAHNDPLTGLPHRAQLERELPALLEQGARAGDSVTVALLNVDRFKNVNESLGHVQGDALLVALAQRLRPLFVPGQGLYRYGGDEFIMVMVGNLVAHALLITQIRGAIAPSLMLDGHAVRPTASIGVASYPEHADSPDVLLRNVEAAMRMAKAQGRNTWRLYAPEMNATVYDDMLLAVELRQAVDLRALELYLQPQFSLADGAMVGMEALLRWKHATRGMVSPARFIPIAESSGLIIDISAWVLTEACRIWAAWRDAGLAPPPMAINLSALQFQQADFLQDVARAMAEWGLPPHALEMELTESLIMTDSEAAVATMHKLVEMGIQLAIDDFGTGYSSLSYLRRFPVRKLKIDRAFVLDLDKGQEGAAIAGAVIDMAKNLHLKVIAEGVETVHQRDFLRDHGCDEVQGFLYARPLPLEEMTALLRERAAAAQQPSAQVQEP
ncbi:MAG TPA: EAL domain-containing protein [Burkholderiaceae bacterium]|nr:EAL domain-containing protein [Burkholderiaceae bacterium]